MSKRYEKDNYLIIAKQIAGAEGHIAIAVDRAVARKALSAIDPDDMRFEIGSSEAHACHRMEYELGLVRSLNEESRCAACGWIGPDSARVRPAGEGFVTCPVCGGHDFYAHFIGG